MKDRLMHVRFYVPVSIVTCALADTIPCQIMRHTTAEDRNLLMPVRVGRTTCNTFTCSCLSVCLPLPSATTPGVGLDGRESGAEAFTPDGEAVSSPEVEAWRLRGGLGGDVDMPHS